MDQDSFRSLLKASATTADPSKSKAYNRGSLLASGSPQAKKAEKSEAAFKPRKVKKPTDSKYRDRASERRGGINEYAEVEGLLKDFETRTQGEDKDVVEEQRKYLGGDATHTVLVKGLDFALLEQNRAREEARDDLDEDLESAFFKQPTKTDTEPTPTDPPATGAKKRTRAELLAELQRSRVANDTSEDLPKAPTREEELQALERAKQAGKFKPIGASSFAPVEKKKKKKKKVAISADSKSEQIAKKIEKGKEKEKDDVQKHSEDAIQLPVTEKTSTPIPIASRSKSETVAAETVPGLAAPNSASDTTPAPATALPIEEVEDVDPFADAGDYEPDYGDDSDAEEDKSPKETSQLSYTPAIKRNWFNDTEPEPTPAPIKPPTPPPQPAMDVEEPEPTRPTRLEGLSSSAMPSISEYLAMDKEEAEREKKRARKEKKKKGGG